MGSEKRHPSKKAALAELAKLTRAAGAPLPSNEIPLALYDTLLHHFGGIQRARRAAGLADPPQARQWSEADVVAEVRALHRDGVIIRYRDLDRAGREDLIGAIRTYLGSIVRARRLAGVPEPERAKSEQEMWDEDRVIEDILDLAERGECLAYSKAPPKLSNAGARYFGTWEAAITAAGLDYDVIRLRRKPYDDDAMIARIHELAQTHPDMTWGELHEHPDGQAMWRRYGTIAAAVEAAGVFGWPIRVMHAAYTEEEVIRALKARHRAGKRLTKLSIDADDSRLKLGVRRHFRTMSAALAAAGLSSVDAAKRIAPVWTREAVIAELRRLAKQNGVVKSTDLPSGLARACTRYFGTWEQTLAAARVKGLGHVPRGHWTRERVLEVLRDRERDGLPNSSTELPSSLMSAVWRTFGSIDAARAAASRKG